MAIREKKSRTTVRPKAAPKETIQWPSPENPVTTGSPAPDTFETLKKEDLLVRARDLNIRGRSRMTREGLIKALRGDRSFETKEGFGINLDNSTKHR